MRYLPRPSMTLDEVYDDCLRVVRNPNLRSRLEACLPLIKSAEADFDKKVNSTKTYKILRHELINDNITSSEMIAMYTDRMVGNIRGGRSHYEKLLISAPKGLCTLCGHQKANVLDHYLPKAHYPILAIVPINLVPSCRDCNTIKLQIYPNKPEEETLHPYYDNIEDEVWLKMKVLPLNPVVVDFYVDCPAHWNNLLRKRVEHHFNIFDINSIYSTPASTLLTDLKHLLMNTFNSGAGKKGVQKLLSDHAESCQVANKNSWQSAFYLGLANDNWFCSHGFNQI